MNNTNMHMVNMFFIAEPLEKVESGLILTFAALVFVPAFALGACLATRHYATAQKLKDASHAFETSQQQAQYLKLSEYLQMREEALLKLAREAKRSADSLHRVQIDQQRLIEHFNISATADGGGSHYSVMELSALPFLLECLPFLVLGLICVIVMHRQKA
jgi:hypothetical protein